MHNHTSSNGHHGCGHHGAAVANGDSEGDCLEFTLNGEVVKVKQTDPNKTLLEYLRESGLTGTKLGCGEGGCGACSVVVEGETVNSCLTPLCAVDSRNVITVEGIGNVKNPHPVQKIIAESHGSQCGFCTPGFVMSLYNTVENRKAKFENLDIEACADVDVAGCFDGNLCRCTGYRPLLDAAKKALEYEEKEEDIPGEANGNGTNGTHRPCGHKTRPGGKLSKTVDGEKEDSTIYLPTSVSELLNLKSQNPEAKIIAGNTELGVEHRFKHTKYNKHIFINNIEELKQISLDDDGTLKIGGGATLSKLMLFLKSKCATLDVAKTKGFKAMNTMMKWFASTQIRNMATLSGNIVTASPISDMNPVLLALDAVLHLRSVNNKVRKVELKDFFLAYRKVNMHDDEIIDTIEVPPTSKYEFVECYKQARRREDDISIVNACFKMTVDPSVEENIWKITKINMAYGGVAPTTVRAKETEKFLIGKSFTAESINLALERLSKELELPDGVPGGMAKYRTTLVLSFLYKFYLRASLDLANLSANSPVELPAVESVSEQELSGADTYMTAEHENFKSTQVFNPYHEKGGLQKTEVAGGFDHTPSEDTERAPVGKPIPHQSALAQCTGEARYVDDIPTPSGSLHSAFLLSKRPHAKIISINISEAEQIPGFITFISAKDMTDDTNTHGPVNRDEELFRENIVTSTGQPIGLVVAETHNIAKEAARKIKVDYEDLPAIISINDAREAKSFWKIQHEIRDGDIEKGFEEADVVVTGEVKMAGQNHFYLETNASLAVPGEDGELTIFASTQNPDKTQYFTASCCGLPEHKVVCRMKRMGGAFGGKETRSVFISAAVGVAAMKLNKPVKMVLDRDEDMWITGTRHPFMGVYKAGAKKDGTLVALDVDLYSNAGYSTDLSESVMDRALFHIDGTYKFPNLRVKGYLCMTNTTTNTAFRGFGGPQGLFVCETVMTHLADELKMEPEILRFKNMYKLGQKTHFRQALEDSPLRRLWQEMMNETDYKGRSDSIAKFNEQHRWKKRGISIIATKFGISFTAKFLNQAGALVNVYKDGTVLVTHGGTEMGQGLHTKVIQVAAREFGIPVSDVHISETATDKVPNSSPTAASASSDMYGMAVLNACEQINARLAGLRAESPNLSFKELVLKAYFARIDLSAHGFYATPFKGFNFDDPEAGAPFNYFTYGASCTEVEVDVLTGDSRMIRADVVMDLGKSLNPAIDVGQIEGGFLQGFGWSMIEEPVWGCKELGWIREGDCFTRGPGTYKIPASDDIPFEFNIRLLDDSPNKKAIHSSRAVGEPPFFLGASAHFAARKAIAAARKDALNDESFFPVDSPLSAERTRMACVDKFTQLTCEKDYKPSLFA